MPAKKQPRKQPKAPREPKRVTRYTHDEVKEPRTPKTGRTAHISRPVSGSHTLSLQAERRILSLRHQRVMLDFNLAELYALVAARIFGLTAQ